jgi:hypothetical protein
MRMLKTQLLVLRCADVHDAGVGAICIKFVHCFIVPLVHVALLVAERSGEANRGARDYHDCLLEAQQFPHRLATRRLALY